MYSVINIIFVAPMIMQISDVPETIASSDPKRNASWIGEFTVEDGESSYQRSQ